MKTRPQNAAREGIAATLAFVTLFPRFPKIVRVLAGALLVAYWIVIYRRYRRGSQLRTKLEFDQLRATDWVAYWRHYNERVPTIEEEFELWGPYHQHRHEMRYDLLASTVRKYLPDGGRVLDVGCGSVLVADRLQDRKAHYVGVDFGGPHVLYAKKKYDDFDGPLHVSIARGDAEGLPFPDASFDVIVMSEVIEHLIRPELAVWEISRLLRPGGVWVMTTNNACEVPLMTPLSQPLAWLENAFGSTHPSLVSRRPWVWPTRVDPELLPPGSPDVYIPHSHHIPGESIEMFRAAGLETVHWTTFEFPPPNSRIAQRLSHWGAAGRKIADMIEAVFRHTPLVNRLGTHWFAVARKVADPVATTPPPGTWPGPLSGSTRELARLGFDPGS